jgi:hypothetical protein
LSVFSKFVYTESDLNVHFVPPWQNPIDVPLAEESRSDFSLEVGLTYGVVATELAELEWPKDGFPFQVVERVGLEPLVHTSRTLDDRAPSRRDVALHARRIRAIVEHELIPIVEPVLLAATESRAVGQPVSEEVLAFIEAYGPSRSRPRRLLREGRVLWGHRFEHLLERVAVELFELYALNARVRRCRYCNSVFVPRRDERFCRWNLWRSPVRLGDPPLRYCSKERAEASARTARKPNRETAYTRERKRLNTKLARERKRAIENGQDPAQNARVKAAEGELAGYVAEYGPPRGRPKNPDTHNLDDVADAPN